MGISPKVMTNVNGLMNYMVERLDDEAVILIKTQERQRILEGVPTTVRLVLPRELGKRGISEEVKRILERNFCK